MENTYKHAAANAHDDLVVAYDTSLDSFGMPASSPAAPILLYERPRHPPPTILYPPTAAQATATSAAQKARVHLSVMLAGFVIMGAASAFMLMAQNWGLVFYLLLPVQCLAGLPLILGAVRLARRGKVSRPEPTLLKNAHLPCYSVLIPLYKEANMLAQISTMLAQLDYPHDKLDILILLEHDDHETQIAAWRMNWAPYCRFLIVPPSTPRTKPNACNYGLAEAKGDYLVIYDAEDKPHPLQLRAAASYFAATPLPVACLQAPLTISDDAHWLRRHFAFEYHLLFKLVLPALTWARLAIPLGGTSNHFRIAPLRALRGWDAYNLTEDADLGYRLAQSGFRTHILPYATTENAPSDYRAWFYQRTRWLSGHIQTWHVHMSAPRQTARGMGLGNMLVMNIVLGTRLAIGPVHCLFVVWLLYMVFAGDRTAPLAWSYAPLFYSALFYASVLGAGLMMRVRLSTLFSLPVYWLLITPPTLYACWRMARRDYRWLKSAHTPYEQAPYEQAPYGQALERVKGIEPSS